MADENLPDFSKFSVQNLQNFLRARGIPYTKKKKEELVTLATRANSIYAELEPDDHEKSDQKRRKVLVEKQVCDLSKSKVTYNVDLSPIFALRLPCVFVYLVEQCKWTNTRLAKYEKDDGYLLYESGHVEMVKRGDIQKHTQHFYLTAAVKPEQRQTQDRYSVWLLIERNGTIISGGCQCVAADDGTCKHVVATLFAVCDFIEKKLQDKANAKSCTDLPCQWIAAKKVVDAQPIKNADLTGGYGKSKIVPKAGYSPTTINDAKLHNTQTNILNLVRRVKPDALLLTLTDDKPQNSANVKSLKDYYMEYLKSKSQLEFSAYLQMIITDEDIESVKNVQQNTTDWMSLRRGRLTASSASLIRSYQNTNYPCKTLLDRILCRTQFSSASVKFGKKWESTARLLYSKELYMDDHNNMRVEETGLFISKDAPFLGASPDGLVLCKCHGRQRLVEIKSSYKHKDITPHQIVDIDKNYHFTKSSGKVVLKTTSSWYDQIQFQMGVTEVHQCDLVVFTLRGIMIIPVTFNPDLWIKMKQNASDMFNNHIASLL